MLLEFLVAGLCIGGYECNKSVQAYYYENKRLQEIFTNTKIQAEKMAGPVMVNYFIPYSVAIGLINNGQSATINIGNDLSINGSLKEQKVNLVWTIVF